MHLNDWDDIFTTVVQTGATVYNAQQASKAQAAALEAQRARQQQLLAAQYASMNAQPVPGASLPVTFTPASPLPSLLSPSQWPTWIGPAFFLAGAAGLFFITRGMLSHTYRGR